MQPQGARRDPTTPTTPRRGVAAGTRSAGAAAPLTVWQGAPRRPSASGGDPADTATPLRTARRHSPSLPRDARDVGPARRGAARDDAQSSTGRGTPSSCPGGRRRGSATWANGARSSRAVHTRHTGGRGWAHAPPRCPTRSRPRRAGRVAARALRYRRGARQAGRDDPGSRDHRWPTPTSAPGRDGSGCDAAVTERGPLPGPLRTAARTPGSIPPHPESRCPPSCDARPMT